MAAPLSIIEPAAIPTETYSANTTHPQQEATALAAPDEPPQDAEADAKRIQLRVREYIRQGEIVVAFRLAQKLPVSPDRDQLLSELHDKAVELDSYTYAYDILQESYASVEAKMDRAAAFWQHCVEEQKWEIACKVFDMAIPTARPTLVKNLIRDYRDAGDPANVKNAKDFIKLYAKYLSQNEKQKDEPKQIEDSQRDAPRNSDSANLSLGIPLLAGARQDHFALCASWVPRLITDRNFPKAAEYFQKLIAEQEKLKDPKRIEEYNFRLMELASNLARDGYAGALLPIFEHLRAEKLPIFLANVLLGRLDDKQPYRPAPDFPAKRSIQDIRDQSGDISAEVWEEFLGSLPADQLQPAIQCIYEFHVDKKLWLQAAQYANRLEDLTLRCQCFLRLMAKFRESGTQDLAPLTQALQTFSIPVIREALLRLALGDQSDLPVANSLGSQGELRAPEVAVVGEKRKAEAEIAAETAQR